MRPGANPWALQFFRDFERLREIEDSIELLEDLDGGYFQVFVNSEFGERFGEIDVTQIRARAVTNMICPPGFAVNHEQEYVEVFFLKSLTSVQSRVVLPVFPRDDRFSCTLTVHTISNACASRPRALTSAPNANLFLQVGCWRKDT